MNKINNINLVNPTFNGLRISKNLPNTRKIMSEIIANTTQQNSKDILELTQNAETKRLNFFRTLAEKYKRENYYLKAEYKEDVNLVNTIFAIVENPTSLHSSLARNFHGSFQTLKRTFEAGKDKTKYLNLASQVNNMVIGSHSNYYENLIPELLESKHVNEYAKNFNKYRPYLRFTRNEQDSIKNLDKMVTEGTYNRKKYEQLLQKRKLINNFPYNNSEIFNKKVYIEHFTPERAMVFDAMHKNFYVPKDIVSTKNDEELLKLFTTTTSKNYKLRIAIMKQYPEEYIYLAHPEADDHKIVELNKLFERIEQDKYAENFIKKIIKNETSISQVSELNTILDSVPSEKLDIFSKNATKIINNTANNKKRISILQTQLEYPFYETISYKSKYHDRDELNFISRLITKLINNYNIARYKRLNITAKTEPVYRDIPDKIEPEMKVITQETKPVLKVIKPEMPEIQKVKEEAKPVIETIKPDKPEVQELKEAAKVIKPNQKEEVRKNIFEILNSKLGEKTFAKQREAYGKNATKMRLGMLPEIFLSIADTRKTDRAVGKHRINSSNKDALDLYLLINGSNKKFINYMLKKRNVDNTRMFEVKDIISMVKKAEAKIAEDKKINPEYRARDARKYYNHLYEAKLEQYGKVARQSKVNTKA